MKKYLSLKIDTAVRDFLGNVYIQATTRSGKCYSYNGFLSDKEFDFLENLKKSNIYFSSKANIKKGNKLLTLTVETTNGKKQNIFCVKV